MVNRRLDPTSRLGSGHHVPMVGLTLSTNSCANQHEGYHLHADWRIFAIFPGRRASPASAALAIATANSAEPSCQRTNIEPAIYMYVRGQPKGNLDPADLWRRAVGAMAGQALFSRGIPRFRAPEEEFSRYGSIRGFMLENASISRCGKSTGRSCGDTTLTKSGTCAVKSAWRAAEICDPAWGSPCSRRGAAAVVCVSALTVPSA